jgi:adenylosuccinate synthase
MSATPKLNQDGARTDRRRTSTTERGRGSARRDDHERSGKRVADLRT